MVVNKKCSESVSYDLDGKNVDIQPYYTVELSEEECKTLFGICKRLDENELDAKEYDTLNDLGDTINKFNHD